MKRDCHNYIGAIRNQYDSYKIFVCSKELAYSINNHLEYISVKNCFIEY